jgi:hypothetical protein
LGVSTDYFEVPDVSLENANEKTLWGFLEEANIQKLTS